MCRGSTDASCVQLTFKTKYYLLFMHVINTLNMISNNISLLDTGQLCIVTMSLADYI